MDMNHNVQVDLESIKLLSKNIKNGSENLEMIINELIEMTNYMDSFFNTPTGQTTKESLLKYLNESKRPCRNLENLSYKINLFKRNYEELYNVTKQSVGGK